MTYRPRQLTRPEALDALHRAELLPWRQAADLVGVNHRLVTRWIDRGHVPYITLEGRRHVDLAHLAHHEHQRRRVGTTCV